MKPKKLQSMITVGCGEKVGGWLSSKSNKNKKTVCDFGDLSKIKVNQYPFSEPFRTNHWLIKKKKNLITYIVTVNV